MKRSLLIAGCGIALAVVSYFGVYLGSSATHRSLLRKPKPELAWLKKEYHLNEAQFARITELHEAYKPKCMAMCRRINEKNEELQKLLAATNAVTPEIKRKLADAAQVRTECQTAMLQH